MSYTTQNDLLLQTLLRFYNRNNNLDKMLSIISGESRISLRIVDWFVTNYSKQNYTLYNVSDEYGNIRRFKVYIDYKSKLKAYSKKRFDPFCRWERISIPYKNNSCIETTIGQLNFFKWVLDNNIINYIEEHYDDIEQDMNHRNSTSKRKDNVDNDISYISDINNTRKRREELSVSAAKNIIKEKVEIVVKFG